MSFLSEVSSVRSGVEPVNPSIRKGGVVDFRIVKTRHAIVTLQGLFHQEIYVRRAPDGAAH